MKLKLKKKTRKRLKRLARRVGRVSAVLASEMLSELAASFLERGADRIEAEGHRRSARASNGHARMSAREIEREARLPRTADHS